MTSATPALLSTRAAAPGQARRAPARRGARAIATLATGLVLCLGGCSDPARDGAIAALGDEDPDVPVGPLHRPGQPCNTCHDGGEARAFSLAGTVYAVAGHDLPAPGTAVLLVDEAGRRHATTTNCAGNFFILPGDFTPDYPLWVSIKRGPFEIEMDSPIHREGSCAGCHYEPADPSSAGRVYADPFATEAVEVPCP